MGGQVLLAEKEAREERTTQHTRGAFRRFKLRCSGGEGERGEA